MFRKLSSLVVVVLTILAVCASASATTITVGNPGFETGSLSSWSTYCDVGGAGNAAAYANDGGTFQSVTAEGSYMAYMNSHYWQAQYGNTGIYQSLAATFTAGKSYTLTVGVAAVDAVAGKSYTSPQSDHATDEMEIRFFWDNEGTRTVIASQEVVYGDLSTTATTDYSITLPAVLSSAAYEGETIGIWLQSSPHEMTTAKNTYWLVDNVRVTENIPEPGTFALVAIGLFGLLAYAWRRRKAVELNILR